MSFLPANDTAIVQRMTAAQQAIFILLLVGSTGGGIIVNSLVPSIPLAGVFFQGTCLAGMLFLFNRLGAVRARFVVLFCLILVTSFLFGLYAKHF